MVSRKLREEDGEEGAGGRGEGGGGGGGGVGQDRSKGKKKSAMKEGTSDLVRGTE